MTSEPAPVAVRFENLRRIYRMGDTEVRALDGVTAEFRRGSFWAIMGPSGSGKSTMLNLLGCLDHPSEGRYVLNGQDISTLDDNELSDIRLRYLGFIFQSFNLIAQLTVEENIRLPLYYLGWDHQHSVTRARELAARVGLESRLHHRPRELSGGQQQHRIVDQGAGDGHALLLADEPTGNLDSATGEEIMAVLAELNRQGKTIIMVTHEASVAAHATHQLHMRDGVIDRIEGDAA